MRNTRWAEILIVGLLLVANVGECALAQAGGWSTPVMISTNTISSWFSDVVVDAWGQPHVVWNSGRPAEEGQMDLLMYSTLVDQEWLEPNDIAVTAYGGYTVRPAIAVDDAATLHVTFRGETTVYYTSAPVSQAGSAVSWTPRKRISTDAGTAYYSDVAVDAEGGVHVVWNEGVSTDDEERWLWFGTREGVAVYDGKGWRTQEPREGLGGREIYDSVEDNAGAQWFGTDQGAYRFDGVTWQVFTTQDGLAGSRVGCVAQDLDGRLWFGTDEGVSRYDREEKRDEQWAVYTLDTGLPDNVVHAIAIDPWGVVWVGTEKGLASYDDRDWVSYTPQDGLVAAEVLAVAVDGRGDVWAGTKQGVSYYDGKRWMTYTVESGLLSDVVTGIVIDHDDAVWFGTDRGLSRFDGQEWKSYTTAEGLSGGAVTALMVDSAGIIWVATEMGVSHYDGQVWETFELARESVGQTVTSIAEDRRVNAMCPSCADVFYRHSTNRGKDWSPPINLSNSFAGSVKPQVRLGSGGSVYVTWEEGEDWYTYGGYPVASMVRYSPDGGNTWAEPTVFSSTLGVPQQITLGIGQRDDLIAIWRVSRTEDERRLHREDEWPVSEKDLFYYQLSTDSGTTWSEPEPVPGVVANLWAPFSLYAYDTATDSAGNVHLLVLGHFDSLEEDLALIHLVWNGSEWSSPTRIYASSDPPEWPRIDVGAGNKVYATWFTRDERHIEDPDRGRYKIWVSSFQANAPSQTPVLLSPPSPTPVPSVLEPAASNPTPAPTPVVVPDSPALPSGLYTENDDLVRLALALSPVLALLLIIVAIRLGWFGRRS